jgi:hypothetical protein
MPHVPSTPQWNPSWNLQAFFTQFRKLWEQMRAVVNNHISFGNPNDPEIQGGVDNVDGIWVSFTIATANTDLTLTHNLGRVPVGYIVMSKTAACDIFTGTVAATTTQITIQGTVAGVSGWLFIV